MVRPALEAPTQLEKLKLELPGLVPKSTAALSEAESSPIHPSHHPGISKPSLGEVRKAYGLRAREPIPGMNHIIMAGLEVKCH